MESSIEVFANILDIGVNTHKIIYDKLDEIIFTNPYIKFIYENIFVPILNKMPQCKINIEQLTEIYNYIHQQISTFFINYGKMTKKQSKTARLWPTLFQNNKNIFRICNI